MEVFFTSTPNPEEEAAFDTTGDKFDSLQVRSELMSAFEQMVDETHSKGVSGHQYRKWFEITQRSWMNGSVFILGSIVSHMTHPDHTDAVAVHLHSIPLPNLVCR